MAVAFVGSYARREDPGIHVIGVDTEAGTLSPIGAFAGVLNPSYVTVHPNGNSLYAVSETGRSSDGMAGSVHALGIDRRPGVVALTGLNELPSGGDHPCHLRIDATGRWLVVTNYSSGHIRVVSIRGDGSLGTAGDDVLLHGRGAHPDRQRGPHPHSSIFTPDNRFLIVADLGADRLAVYAFDAVLGTIAEEASLPTRPGAGPRHLAFHPEGGHLLVANELDNTLDLWRSRGQGGRFDLASSIGTQIHRRDPEGLAADIHIDPSGRIVSVSNRGADTVASFRVDGSASLVGLGEAPSCGSWPRSFSITPDGRYLLVANERSHRLSLLPCDGDGGVGRSVADIGIDRPACVAFG